MSLVEWNSKENNSSSDLKTDDCIVKKCKTEGTVIQLFHASETESRDGSSNREHENFGFKQKVSSNFDFLHTKESTRSGPGWLLFRIKTSASPESLQESQADGLSVVQWVLSLPNRSKEATTNIQIDVVSKEAESYVENNICGHEDKHSEACLAASMKLPKKLGCFFKLCSSGCKQFSYEELRRETHHFSSVLILSF
jgi:interleukin-1 receptor-associated kinase 1